MYCSTTVNKPFTARVAEARPLSHAAAATLLCTSIYAVHTGAEMALTAAPGLVTATTAAIIGFEWLQWTSLGRITKLEAAGEHSRASVLKLQCLGIAGLQVILYTIAVVGYAKAGGADWSGGWPLFGAIAIAMLFAGLNFVAKWTSCDSVATPDTRAVAGPTGGARAPLDAAIFGDTNALPAGVVELKQRVAKAAEERPFRTGLAAAPAKRAKATNSEISEWASRMAHRKHQLDAQRRQATA